MCADVDRAVHLDPRPLQALLQAEKSVTVSEAQIRHEQRVNCGGGARDEPGIEEWARAKAVEWMHEVAERGRGGGGGEERGDRGTERRISHGDTTLSLGHYYWAIKSPG